MDTALEAILASVMIGATLAFGGVQPGAYSFTEAVIFLAFFALLVKQAWQGRVSLAVPVWPCVFLLLAAFQMIPLPLGLVAKVSPLRAWDPALAGGPTGGGGQATLTIYPHSTALALAKLAAYFAAFLLAAHLFDSRKRKSILVKTLIFLGVAEAAYGLFQYETGSPKIFNMTKQYDVGQATGTYINRNHFAGLLELTFPFIMAAIFYSYQSWLESRKPGARRSSRGAVSLGARALSYFFLLVVMMLGVLFSHSRMGIMVSVGSAIFVVLLMQLRTGQKIWMVGLAVFLVGVVSYALWIGLDPVLARFEQMQSGGPGSIGMDGRFSLWKDEIRLIRDSPLLGTGLGTFRRGFPPYQTSSVDLIVDHAHNDYLEFASETGLVGAALLFLPIFYLFGRMVLAFLSDRRRYRRSVILGCLGSTLALLLHSLADFNLQLPANALIFAVVLGIGYKTACLEPREERTAEPLAARVATSPTDPFRVVS